MADDQDAAFAGSDRFVVEDRLGAGGMGVVYRVFDRVRHASVALKLLRNVSPNAILRFKSEFRALAGVSHPNLVTMYELLSDADQWFFTMELVDGVDFLAYVRGPEAVAIDTGGSRTAETARIASEGTTEPRTAQTVDLGSTSNSGNSARGLPTYAPATSPAQIARLRDAARQLAAGVAALHRTGRLHRDLKPSNVLVTREGRLVVLDFGLVAALASGQRPSDERNLVLGTPHYMAPEQAAARAATEASDWYAVGTMLYHALTGQLPFPGSADYVLACKRSRTSVPPVAFSADAPADLASLCDGMLAVDPSARPGEADILGQLRVQPEVPVGPPAEPAGGDGALHGRDQHLEALRDAYRVVVGGEPQVVFVHGRSGMGKTALVNRFLDELRAAGATIVLEGRCHECESVPYKAIDSLVDALVRYLLTLPDDVAADVVPRDIRLLARLFPVLRRVPAVADALPTAIEGLDPLELRRRGFEAFRALVANVAALGPTVLFIDDLQWGEMDSALLLEHLMRGLGAPPVLLLLTYRREDADTSAPLAALRAAWPSARTLAVDPLSRDESKRLALALLGESRPDSEDVAESIAREAHGSPFFVHELADDAARSRDSSAPARLPRGASLDEVLRARVRQLPAHARRLLEVVAVAGRPTPQALASRAAELDRDEQAAIALLRNGKWARTRGVRVEDEIECFHDRIREAVVAQLAADQMRGHHARLGRVLREAGGVDPEILSVHYENAGDLDEAALLSAAAADTAAQAVAFDRAAALYRRALELRPNVDPETELALRRRLADALANARRGPDAAGEYRRASELADDRTDSLSLRRRAAEELLRSGHVDAGMELLGQVLAAEGMRLPATPRAALASLIVRRARVRLRGLRFHRREADEVQPTKRRRIDLCWSVASGLAMVDNIRGADYQARSLLLALASGDTFQVTRALAAEAGFAAVAGGPGRRRAERLQARADELARSLADPYLIGFAKGVAGISAFLRGDWSAGKHLVVDAERILREQCAGAGWELDMTRLYYCWCLVFRGELAEASETIPRYVQESEDRGDIYAAANLRTTLSNLVWLAADDIDEARANADNAMLQWSQQGFFMQHFYDLLARGNIDLYAETGRQAYERITAAWPALSRAMILRVQYCRITLRDMRARGAIAGAHRAASEGDRERLLRDAERDARRLEREKMAWSDPLAQLLRAGVAAVRDRPEHALEHLERAARGFDECDMALHAAVARRRIGQLRAGDQGEALARESDAWMRNQRIARPARMSDMLAPGFG